MASLSDYETSIASSEELCRTAMLAAGVPDELLTVGTYHKCRPSFISIDSPYWDTVRKLAAEHQARIALAPTPLATDDEARCVADALQPTWAHSFTLHPERGVTLTLQPGECDWLFVGSRYTPIGLAVVEISIIDCGHLAHGWIVRPGGLLRAGPPAEFVLSWRDPAGQIIGSAYPNPRLLNLIEVPPKAGFAGVSHWELHYSWMAGSDYDCRLVIRIDLDKLPPLQQAGRE